MRRPATTIRLENIATSLLVVAMGFLITSCVDASARKTVPYACKLPPPAGAGQTVAFKGTIGGTSRRALHMDFDTYGVDFDSVAVTLEAPETWAGRSVQVFRHDAVSPANPDLLPGQQLAFQAVVPDCLDSPWLFLEDIQPALSQPSVPARSPY